MGKRSHNHYTERISKMICEHVATGEGLKSALKKIGTLAPSVNAVWKWIEEYPEFRASYDRALQMQANMHADRIVELAEEALTTPSKAAAIRVATDIYKWNAEMRDPAKYSPKAPQEVKQPPKSVDEMRAEIERLQKELGVADVQPGMVTAPRQPKGNDSAPTPNLKVVGSDE
jgi:hypothetical protein